MHPAPTTPIPPDVETPEGPSRRRHLRFGVAVVVLALSLLGVGVLGNPASAYTTTTRGWAGTVQPYRVETRTKLVYDRGVALYKPGLNIPAPVVYRPAGSTGAQTFFQTIEIKRYNGSAWVTLTLQSTTRTIAAGSQWNYGAAFHTALGGGFYTVVIGTAWSNGASTVTMNGPGDYSCSIFGSYCYPNYVYLTG